MPCGPGANDSNGPVSGTLRCAVCGENWAISAPSGAMLSVTTTFRCRKCTAYVPQEPRKRKQRIPPPTREGREIAWDDFRLRTKSGALLSGEEAAYAANCRLDKPHITNPAIRAYAL